MGNLGSRVKGLSLCGLWRYLFINILLRPQNYNQGYDLSAKSAEFHVARIAVVARHWLIFLS